MRRLIDMPEFQEFAAQHPPKPYICHTTLKRWRAGEFDSWRSPSHRRIGEPLPPEDLEWSRKRGRPPLSRFTITAYFGNRTWSAPNGGCHNCGGASCTFNLFENINWRDE